MSSTPLIVMAIVLIILVALALGAWIVMWRQRSGINSASEYDRVIAQSESRLAGEHDLRDRHRHHDALEIRELTPQSSAQYAASWRELQVQFINSPTEAVNAADDLGTRLLQELGYPAGDDDQQVAHLSVDHAATLQSYREAHEISASNRRGEATTEQLRVAVVKFRVLIAGLLGDESALPQGLHDRADIKTLPPRAGEVHVPAQT